MSHIAFKAHATWTHKRLLKNLLYYEISNSEAGSLSGGGSQPQRQRLPASAAEAPSLSGRGSQPQRQRLPASAAEAPSLSGRGSQPQRQRAPTSTAGAPPLRRAS